MDDPEFAEAMETVLRDLRAQCEVQPQLREEGEWLLLYAPDGSGQGVTWRGGGEGASDRLAGLADLAALANLADQVQEWAVEALWRAGEAAVWPHCPEHPNTHPLTATVTQDAAVWACPSSGATVARIGELPNRRQTSADTRRRRRSRA